MANEEIIKVGADPVLVARLKLLSKAAAGLIAATAVVVLLGWIFNIAALKSINPNFVSMKANTAICFLLIGLALWSLPDNGSGGKGAKSGRSFVQLCSVVIILIGGLSLAEYLIGHDLGIDQLFFQDIGAVQTFSPGRMAANTAVCFCLIGLAVLFIDQRDRSNQYPSQYLMLIVAFISLLSIIGYWYHVDAFYGLLQYSKMALHTAVLFALCFFGLAFARPTQGLMALFVSESSGGLILRRPTLIGVGFLLLVGWLRVEGQRAGLYDTAFGASLYAAVSITFILGLLWWTAAQLHDQDLKRRQIGEQLLKAKNDAEAADRLKELLLDILRHDLLGPAGVVKTSLDVILLKEMPPEKQLKFLQLAETSINKMIEMIESAKVYARVASAETLPKEPADLNELFQGVADSYKTTLLERKIGLNYLPLREKKAAVNKMIENVFANLLSNAIKYSPEGSKIEVDIVDQGTNWRLYVKDWGDGITAEDKPTLFTRFKRVDKKGVKGTGLGLAIVKRIVDLHAGRVWIEDNPEGGSIFFVEIPKAVDHGRS
jgi:signal transduction histidine kinase